MAFKQLILREVSRQEGHPHWVNIRSTRSRQVRSLEASAGGETEGRNGSPGAAAALAVTAPLGLSGLRDRDDAGAGAGVADP